MRRYTASFSGALALVCLLSIFPAATPARQSQGSRGHIAGVVKDDAGAVVADTEVSLVNAHQAVLSKTRTDSEGRFRFADVPAGSYAVAVFRQNFGRQRVAVEVAGSGEVGVSVVLQPTQLVEQVTVTAEAGQVSDARNTAQPVNVIGEAEIIERAPEVVAQVVDEEPGVNLQRTSPSLSAVFVRGSWRSG